MSAELRNYDQELFWYQRRLTLAAVLVVQTVRQTVRQTVKQTVRQTVGQTVRVRCMLSNYMYPPKIGGGPAPGMPAFAADPARETYYYAFLLSPDFGAVTGVIGVTFAGADVSEPLFESRVVDLEGVLVADLPVPEGLLQFYARRWLRVTKARQLSIPAASLPAYP